MAKRMKAGPLDESLIIQSFKDADLLADPANAVLQEAGERPAALRRDGEEPAADEAAAPTDGTAKGKSRRRRGSYDEVYLKRRELKTRRPFTSVRRYTAPSSSWYTCWRSRARRSA